MEINWRDFLCAVFFFSRRQTGDVLRISELLISGNNGANQDVLVIVAFSLADFIYESSQRTTLSDKQKRAQLTSLWDHSNDNDGYTVDSEKHHDQSAVKRLGNSVNYKLPVIEICLHYKLFRIFLQNITVDNQLTWPQLKPFLKTAFGPFLSFQALDSGCQDKRDLFASKKQRWDRFIFVKQHSSATNTIFEKGRWNIAHASGSLLSLAALLKRVDKDVL